MKNVVRMMAVITVVALVSVGVALLAFGQGQREAEAKATLIVGSLQTMRDWDSQRRNTHIEFEVKPAIFESLVRVDRETGALLPHLAKSWEWSEDLKEITFYLQEGVHFHKNIGEFTAGDVKYTLERVNEPKWETAQAFQSIERIEIIDKYTVKIYLKAFDATFLPYELTCDTYGGIVPKATQDTPVAEVRRNPIGTGPYELESWTPMEEFVLKRFDDYHGVAPYFEKIVYRIYPERMILELALEKGEVDLAAIAYESIQKFRTHEGIEVYTGPITHDAWVGFNVTREPFDDIRVRKAIRYAVDVEEILEGAFEGATPRAKTVLPPSQLGSWKDAPVYEPDLDLAKDLLVEAGFANGLEASFATSAAYRGDLLTPILIEQLKRIDITLTVTMLTLPALYAELKAGNSDMFFVDYTAARTNFEATRWWTCSQTTPEGYNLTKWCNEEFDALCAKVLETHDAEGQAALFLQMQKVMDEEAVAIWVHHGMAAIGYQDYLEDLTGKVNPSGTISLAELRMKQ